MSPLRVDAALLGDLAALDRLLASWSGSPLKGLAGGWTGHLAVARSVAGRLDVHFKGNVPAIDAPGLKGPVTFEARGDTRRRRPARPVDGRPAHRLRAGVGVGEPAGDEGSKAARPERNPGAQLGDDRRLDGDLGRAQRSGPRNVRPIHLAGSLKADTTPQLLGQVQGEVGLDLTTAEAFGVKLGPAPVVLKLGAGKAKFDPILTKMNDGPVVIQGELAFDDDYGLWLRLGPSRVDNATINEAVSNSILAYAAPVMAKSSQVTGKVTVAVTKAMVPITAGGPLSLEGAMALQNAVFNPGPLGAELTSITGQAAPKLRIDQGMNIQVLNRRVNQTGLVVPIGGDGFRVAIDGSVGFDETLDLKADDLADREGPGPRPEVQQGRRRDQDPPADPGDPRPARHRRKSPESRPPQRRQGHRREGAQGRGQPLPRPDRQPQT